MDKMNFHIIETGYFKLDGGAMFGVVPKVMWNKINQADDENLCTWSMRSLLVEEGNKKILIDTGMGDKQGDKFKSHFHPHGKDSLYSSIADAGFSNEEITDVIITHFHFDHVGGAVDVDTKGNYIPAFPNATYWTTKAHYDWAIEPNSREKASFLKENFVPLREHGVLKYIDEGEDVKFSEHIKINFVNGHTRSMMVPYIEMGNGKTLVYCADLLPSHGHVSLPFVMSYDLFPLTTLDEKAALYERVTDGRHILFFEHDKDVAMGTVVKNEKGRVVFGESINQF